MISLSLDQNLERCERQPWSMELFVHRAGTQLAAVFREQVDPLTVLDASGLSRVYENSFVFQESAQLLAHTIGRLGRQNPYIRILEVGAGTLGCTLRVLEQLTSDTHSRFSSYCFTDISSVFFEPARTKSAARERKMTFMLYLGKDAAS